MPMDTGTSQPKASDGWEEVATVVTRVVFDEIGDVFTGRYVGSEELTGDKDEKFTQWLFKGDDGELYGVFDSYSIRKGMEQIPEGNMVRLSYVNEQDVGKPSPMKVFKIQHRP